MAAGDDAALTSAIIDTTHQLTSATENPATPNTENTTADHSASPATAIVDTTHEPLTMSATNNPDPTPNGNAEANNPASTTSAIVNTTLQPLSASATDNPDPTSNNGNAEANNPAPATSVIVNPVSTSNIRSTNTGIGAEADGEWEVNNVVNLVQIDQGRLEWLRCQLLEVAEKRQKYKAEIVDLEKRLAPVSQNGTC
jgi:hypothetical protein